MNSKSLLFIGLLLIVSKLAFGQTFSGTGTWNTAARWSPAVVPSGASTDVTFANNANATVGANNTIGTISTGNNPTLTVNSGFALTLGSNALFPGTRKNFIINNGGTVAISGTLEIWGDLIVNNTLNLTITGAGILIVHGNVILNNNATIQVGGTGVLTVGGNVSGGNNTAIQTSGSGTIGITGNLSLGNGSTISGPAGSVSTGGTCTCSGCAAQCSSSTLPVTLLSFAAKANTTTIELNWATATELNFDYFDIQRSFSGIDFTSIGQVTGHGTTNQPHNYLFEDKSPLIGRNYYRLRSVDFDGYTEYFKVVLADFSQNKEFSLFPNPTDGKSITSKINFQLDSEYSITIVNSFGVVVGSYTSMQPQVELIFADNLRPGIYFARLSSSEFNKTNRFIVTR